IWGVGHSALFWRHDTAAETSSRYDGIGKVHRRGGDPRTPGRYRSDADGSAGAGVEGRAGARQEADAREAGRNRAERRQGPKEASLAVRRLWHSENPSSR